MNEWLWIFVNIVLPIFLPVGGMFLMRVSLKKPEKKEERKELLKTRRYVLLFKDGQLGWVALLMCFAAVSEFAEGLVIDHKTAPAWTIFVLLDIVLTVLAAGVFATNGAVDTVQVIETESIWDWINYYGVAFWSTIATLGAIVAFITVHFWAIRH
ncbi:hypothetical protein DWU98_20150 [Dyella monticola]|uniref:Uncharacterized protein n=1 Tax=Dyella monticola TaxID=1927958 RepID=A0A370WS41_9GAMM|nr:hypothetical protein [Dyella monticola]RDS78934.1 hypothetical protein DWU98_20150 [Dyella monticola]